MDRLTVCSWLSGDPGNLSQQEGGDSVECVMVAAIIHDVDHPGLTNAFLVRTGDPLATTYNDQSVLENHHLSHFFNLIQQKKEANIFDTTQGQSSYFTEESYREVRRIIISCVMHTDMAMHFSLVSKMNEFVVSGRPHSTTFRNYYFFFEIF